MTEQIQLGKFRIEVSLEDYLGNKTSAVFGEEAHVLDGLIPTYAHESSAVKDPEPAITGPVFGTPTCNAWQCGARRFAAFIGAGLLGPSFQGNVLAAAEDLDFGEG